MALTRSLFATFLLSSLVLASAADYSYDSKPDTTKDSYYNPKPKPNGPYVNIPKPDVTKPTDSYNPKPHLDVVKHDYFSKPKSGYGAIKPDYESTPKYEPKVTIPKPDIVKPSYVPKPKPETVKSTDSYNPKPKPDYVPKPNPEYGYNPKSKLTIPKVETEKPSYKPKPKVDSVKPNYGNAPKPDLLKPGYGYGPKQEKPYPIAIEGHVVCKSGSNYLPIQGAVVKITCKVVDQTGYDTKKPVSCESGATNAKGYFYKKLDLSLGLEDDKLKIGECEAILAKSPVESCKYPTDVNKGTSGALLSSFRILNDKHVKLYSLGPFFYTPKPAPANPAGGY